MNCPICKSKKIILIWNDKIRSSIKKLTQNKKKIFRCFVCDVSFLEKRYKSVPNKSILRKIIRKSQITKLQSFHTQRESPKLKKILEIYNYKNKRVLLANCGYGLTILDQIKKTAKLTAGLSENDYSFYLKEYLIKKNHLYFKNLNDIKKTRQKFDTIISPAEIEHVYDPSQYLKNFKRILTKKGVIILRIPNHDNIYKYVLGKIYLKDDYRISHNFYFSKKSCEFLFKKNGFKINDCLGLMEHDLNNLLHYIKIFRRPMQYDKKNNVKNIFLLNKLKNSSLTKNIEKSPLPSHFLYMIQKN